MNILTNFILPSSLQEQEADLYLKSFMSSKASLITSIPENFSP